MNPMWFTAGSDAAASSWAPTDLGSDLLAWYKADVGVTQASNLVTAWADQSGNGRNLINAGGSQRPAYISSYLNNKAGIGFTLGNEEVLYNLTWLASTEAQPWMVFIVGTIVQSGVTQQIMTIHNILAGQTSYITTLAGNTLRFNNNNSLTTDGSYTPNTAYRIEGLANGVSGGIRFGEEIKTGNAGSAALDQVLYIGGAVPPGTCGGVKYGEIIFIGKSLSAAELTSIRTYILERWGV